LDFKYGGSANQQTHTLSSPHEKKGIDKGNDPTLNHMNYVYSPCQASKGRFTPKQIRRMVAQFETFRAR